jgi:hypothetical protein
MRTIMLAAVAAAAVLAAAGTPPASAASIERISLVATNSSGAFSAIATGAFTDGGMAQLQGPEGMLFLAHGTITITHRRDKPIRHVNRNTCVTVVTHGGTYTIVAGTGTYAAITGSGRRCPRARMPPAGAST